MAMNTLEAKAGGTLAKARMTLPAREDPCRKGRRYEVTAVLLRKSLLKSI